MPTKKKVASKKSVSKKKEVKKIVIHLEADLIGDGEIENGDFHIKGSLLHLGALLATAMDTSRQFKRVVALAVSAVAKDGVANFIDEVTDPINHIGHGCDFDPMKKAPKKKTTKKSK